MSENDLPVLPPRLRTVAYLVGIVAGVGAVPSLLAYGLEGPAAVAAAVSGTANAIAFGYRPTRSSGG